MRFEIPQFIDVEDKIIGPLSWKQFVYVAGGSGAVFMMFLFMPFFLFLVFAVPIAALAGSLAFYKYNNRPLSFLLESIMQYFSGSRLYLWKKRVPKVTASSSAAPTQGYKPPTSSSSLASISRKLELNAIEKK